MTSLIQNIKKANKISIRNIQMRQRGNMKTLIIVLMLKMENVVQELLTLRI